MCETAASSTVWPKAHIYILHRSSCNPSPTHIRNKRKTFPSNIDTKQRWHIPSQLDDLFLIGRLSQRERAPLPDRLDVAGDEAVRRKVIAASRLGQGRELRSPVSDRRAVRENGLD